MSFFKKLIALLTGRKKTDWDSLNYGKPATVKDEIIDLNRN